MKIFKGFTLSELMVALAVIGIIVAIVTPAIMKTRPNKNKMMVKKSFYTVEQIVSTLVNDESVYPDMRETCEAGNNCYFGFDDTRAAYYEGEEYKGPWKFAALFKSRLNVKSPDNIGDEVQNATPDNASFRPVFLTTDGIKWDLTGTVKEDGLSQWVFAKKVGQFNNQGEGTAGVGTIKIDVNGDDLPNVPCTADNADDCDTYEVQILSNGKLRINPEHTTAINWATINTSIKDGL